MIKLCPMARARTRGRRNTSHHHLVEAVKRGIALLARRGCPGPASPMPDRMKTGGFDQGAFPVSTIRIGSVMSAPIVDMRMTADVTTAGSR